MSRSPKKVTFDSHKDDLFLSFEETDDGPLVDHLDDNSADHRLSISQDPIFLGHSDSDEEEEETQKRRTRSTRGSPAKKKKNDKKSPKKSRASPSKDKDVRDEIPPSTSSPPLPSMMMASQYSPAGIVLFVITLCLIIFSISDFGLSDLYRGSYGINSLLRSRYFNVLDNILQQPSVDVSPSSGKKLFTDDEKVSLAYTAANQFMKRYVSMPSTALTWPWTSVVRHHQSKISRINQRKGSNEENRAGGGGGGTSSVSNTMLQDMDPLYSSDLENAHTQAYNGEYLVKHMTNAAIPTPSHKELLLELFGKMGYCDTEEKAASISPYLSQASDDEYIRSWLSKVTFDPFSSSQEEELKLSDLPSIHHPTTEELNVKIDRPLEDAIVHYSDATLSIQVMGSILSPLAEAGYEIKAYMLSTRYAELEAERLERAENETSISTTSTKSISDIAREMMPATRTAVLDIRLDGRPLRFLSGSRYEIPLRSSVSMSFDLNEHGLTNGVHLVEVIVTLEGPPVKKDITISSQYLRQFDGQTGESVDGRRESANTFRSSTSHANKCEVMEAKDKVREQKVRMLRVLNDVRVASSAAFYVYGIGTDKQTGQPNGNGNNDNTIQNDAPNGNGNIQNSGNSGNSGNNGISGDSILVHLVPDESTDVLPLFYSPAGTPILHDAIHMTFAQDQKSVVFYTIVNAPHLVHHPDIFILLHINENDHDITELILKEIHNDENEYIDDQMARSMGKQQGVLKRISLNMTGAFNKGRHTLKMCVYEQGEKREAVQCHEAFIDIV